MSTMTTTVSYRPQLDLPGQTYAAQGPCDLSAIYLMHHGFRRDLGRFVEAVGATPLDDRSTWRALATRWQRFADILHHHHTVEDDEIWPVLRDRATAEERAHLDAMEEEHEGIDPMLAAVASDFAAFADDAVPDDERDRRAGLTSSLVALRESLGRHLMHEETEALPILQRRMTVAEFDAIHQRAVKSFDVSPLYLFPWCAEAVPSEAIEVIGKEIGLPGRVMLRLAQPGFRRRERQAFKYC